MGRTIGTGTPARCRCNNQYCDCTLRITAGYVCDLCQHGLHSPNSLKLKNAVKTLEAVKINVGKWAHLNTYTYPEETESVQTWLVCDAERLIDAARYYDDEIDDHEAAFGYSWWEDFEPMPRGWEPQPIRQRERRHA